MQTNETLLKELALRANNIIMKGSFSGDDITEAADIMKLCHQIYAALNGKETDRTTIKKG